MCIGQRNTSPSACMTSAAGPCIRQAMTTRCGATPTMASAVSGAVPLLPLPSSTPWTRSSWRRACVVCSGFTVAPGGRCTGRCGPVTPSSRGPASFVYRRRPVGAWRACWYRRAKSCSPTSARNWWRVPKTTSCACLEPDQARASANWAKRRSASPPPTRPNRSPKFAMPTSMNTDAGRSRCTGRMWLWATNCRVLPRGR